MTAVEDRLYVVPVGVEDECGVVPGVIVRSQSWPSVVNPSRLQGCGVENVNHFAGAARRKQCAPSRAQLPAL